MLRWYETVLQAKVVHADPKIAFLTYDDEHHRVALVAMDKYAEKPAAMSVGFYHAAFTYHDPDQNNIELQVDAFQTLEECTEFMRGPLFREDPIGKLVDPEEMLVRYQAGVPDSELVKRADRV